LLSSNVDSRVQAGFALGEGESNKKETTDDQQGRQSMGDDSYRTIKSAGSSSNAQLFPTTMRRHLLPPKNQDAFRIPFLISAYRRFIDSEIFLLAAALIRRLFLGAERSSTELE
jgi:hypothetical protein